MKTLYSLLDKAITAIEAYTDCYCCSVLNSNGQEFLFFRSHKILPCSEHFSRAKARTAHAFQCDTRKLLDLPQITAAIRSPDYCFLAGGIFHASLTDGTLFVGVSCDNPEIDHQAALAAAQALSKEEITS